MPTNGRATADSCEQSPVDSNNSLHDIVLPCVVCGRSCDPCLASLFGRVIECSRCASWFHLRCAGFDNSEFATLRNSRVIVCCPKCDPSEIRQYLRTLNSIKSSQLEMQETLSAILNEVRMTNRRLRRLGNDLVNGTTNNTHISDETELPISALLPTNPLLPRLPLAQVFESTVAQLQECLTKMEDRENGTAALSETSESVQSAMESSFQSPMPSNITGLGSLTAENYDRLAESINGDQLLDATLESLNGGERQPFAEHQQMTTSEHMHRKTGKVYKCRFCSYQSNRRWNLQQHERQHTGERPYSCEYCQQQFSRKFAYDAHVAIKHDRLRACQCRFCGRTCASNMRLQIHERTHTGERPFGCVTCNARFTCMASLRSHAAVHEKKADAGNSLCAESESAPAAVS